MRPTFHIVPEAVWVDSDPGVAYEAVAYPVDGFIHCTDGVGPLGATFDKHYGSDPRPFLALTVDLDAIGVPWRFDVPGSPYPHVYGPIARTAILAVARVGRDPHGRFIGLTPV